MTINIEDIKPGDTVTIANAGVGSLELPVEIPPATSHAKVTIPGFGTKCIHDIVKDGWTITDHKPNVELPTEPNAVVYSKKAWAAARRASSGSPKWFADSGACRNGSLTDAQMIGWADDWVRLVPESENRAKIAGEVLDWLAESSRIGPTDIYAARDHFGVDR